MTSDSTQAKPSWGTWFSRGFKALLILLVVVGIAQSIRMAWQDLQRTQQKAASRLRELKQESLTASADRRLAIAQEIKGIQRSQFSLSQVRWWRASLAIPFSCVCLLPTGIFWWLTLKQFGFQVPLLFTLSAYLSGGLGKYVPGKAMVLILRSAAMQRSAVPVATSILSIFIETLTVLAAAGGLATLAITAFPLPSWLRWTLVGTAVMSTVPLTPPIFRPILAFLSARKHLRISSHLAHAISWPFVAKGWLLSALAQLLMGITLFWICAAVRPETSMPEQASQAIETFSLSFLGVCFAATSIGFVIGFLSMLPGGAGARELVVTLLLAPVIGYAPALASAVLFRMTSLLGELIMATFFWLYDKSITPRQNQQPTL